MSVTVTLGIMTFPYWVDSTLTLDWWSLPGALAKKTRSNRVNWDPSKTQILSVKLHGRIWAGFGSKGTIRFNNEPTQFGDATWGDAQVDSIVDVSGLLRSGENECSIELVKVIGLEKAGVFSAELIIEYSGVAPGYTGVEEPVPWLWWVVTAAVGGAAVITVIGIVGYYEARRREELMMLMRR